MYFWLKLQGEGVFISLATSILCHDGSGQADLPVTITVSVSSYTMETWSSILGQQNLSPKKKWFYVRPFWGSIYEAGVRIICGSK